MQCKHPLKGWRSRTVNPSGKRSIVFSARDGYHDLPVLVPCGQCVGCRLERSRQWAVRCLHEASLSDRNCFVTLTYDDAHYPVGGSLDKSAFPKFMKRLRKEFPHERIRYFHCGEYGELLGRPHYHACLFGFDFPDKVAWTTRQGYPVWRSPVLESLWPFGLSEVGSVTFESAAYVARYILKKVTGSNAEDYYRVCDARTGEIVCRVPEYVTMSRRPGIGREWLEKYMCEVYPSDAVVVRGRLARPPRAYDVVLEACAPDAYRRVTARRVSRFDPAEATPERLAVQEKVLLARVSTFARGLE